MSDVATPSAPRKDYQDDFDSWREPLLASLRDCGVQRAPRHVVLRYLLAIVVMATTIFIASALGRLLGEILRNAPPPVWIIAYGLYFVFVVAVLSRIRNYFLRRAWQSSARSAEDELARLGSRRPILYLRSFGLDRRLGRPSWFERFLGTRPFANTEQQITAKLRPLGPVIAIGRPGEQLPPLGAARFYVSHERWQEKVDDVRKASQLVLWATGVTEGLKWELNHLIDNLNPKRLIVWAHPHLLGVSAPRREEEWKRFRDSVGSIFPKPLPERLGSARFFVFDAGWNPIPVSPRLSDTFTGGQLSALRQALLIQQNGIGNAEREQLEVVAARREPTELGSLIGVRQGPIYWPLLAAFFAALVIGPLGVAIWEWILVALGRMDPAYSPSVLAVFGGALVRTAAAAVAFRFIRPGLLAALAAGGAVALAFFLFRIGSLFGGEASLSEKFVLGVVAPLFREVLLFVLLAWTVRRWSPLAMALFGGVFFASIIGAATTTYLSNFYQFMDGITLRNVIENFAMAAEQLPHYLPGWLGTSLVRAAAFAAGYVVLLKLLPAMGLDERKPAIEVKPL